MVLYPVADGYPDGKYPNSAYGKTAFLYVGNSYDHAQDIWGSERIYIRFDVKDLPKNHPIAKATLHLWQYYAPASSQTYETHRVLGYWNETTLNWKNQPSWAAGKTSEAIAPPQAEVPVEWDITQDVQAWYSGAARNYGTMIKVANEEHAKDASSGFWSREYPVGSHEEWRPKLIVTFQESPTLTYVVSVSVSGVPGTFGVNVDVDGKQYATLHRPETANITFDRGTIHTVAVTGMIPDSPGVRYVCDANQTQVSNATSLVFSYAVEYLATFSGDSGKTFETPPTGWYRNGTILPIPRIGSDTYETAPGTRVVFDGTYLNGQRLATEPKEMTVNAPFTLELRYRTEYYLNVTSPVGETTGSGWYPADTVASFAIDRTMFPAQGFLGILGLKLLFEVWTGSGNFVGLPVEPRGSVAMKEATTITALWREDWSTLILNVAYLVLVVCAFALALRIVIPRLRAGSRTGKAPDLH
jgi:hypothetical protein